MAVLDGDILRVSVNFELGNGSLYQNIYHYIRDGTDPISDAEHVTRLRIAMESAYGTLAAHVKGDVVEQLSFVDRVEFNEITDQWEVVENIGTFTAAFTPVGATDEVPHQSAPYIIFKTGRPKTIGKKFLFPFLETSSAGSILTSAAVTAVVAYGVQILASLVVGGDVTLTAGVPRTGIQAWYNFLVAVVGDVIGSQRRRKPNVGA